MFLFIMVMVRKRIAVGNDRVGVMNWGLEMLGILSLDHHRGSGRYEIIPRVSAMGSDALVPLRSSGVKNDLRSRTGLDFQGDYCRNSVQ